jgi:hypothetical protein
MIISPRRMSTNTNTQCVAANSISFGPNIESLQEAFIPQMSPPWTNLAGLAIGASLYGVYFVLYVSSTYLLIQRSTGAHASPLYRSAIFVSGLFLFIAVTGVGVINIGSFQQVN